MTNNKTKSISPIRPGFGGRSAHMMGMMPANIKNSKGTMKRLWHYLKRQKWQLTFVLFIVKGDKTNFLDETSTKVIIEYEKYHILDTDN
ncbi:MAG: hypothetical protein PHI90_10890, partial [Clostridia bacterium]|nr:hypothetical protein [Clostridia bacterium]